jgi:hypothetical protein
MNITQSALSGLIKELEQTLGVQVVNCSTRKMGLAVVDAHWFAKATYAPFRATRTIVCF